MPAESDPLRIAIVPGVTVTKWTTAWRERRRNAPLTVTPCDEGDQLRVLHDGLADVSFVRLPVEREGLSVIRLYSEVPVVVLSKEHPLALAESVTMAELDGEFVRPEAAADAVEIVAAGAGIMLVPHSVARQNGRKDVTAVPISDAPETEIAVAWLEDATTPDVEEFVGVVRGRRPGSSRGPARDEQQPSSSPSVQKQARAKQGGGGAGRSGGKAKAKPAAKHPPKSQARGRKKTGRG